MHEIVVVEACRYEQGSEVYTDKFIEREENRLNVLWWFADPTMDLKSAIYYQADNPPYGNFKCEAIKFEFDFCPNPDATNFDVSALHDECMYARNIEELFNEDLPKLVEIVKRHLASESFNPYHSIGMVNFCLLYDVEIDKHYDDDGGTDEINVWPTFVGEIDFMKLATLMQSDS